MDWFVLCSVQDTCNRCYRILKSLHATTLWAHPRMHWRIQVRSGHGRQIMQWHRSTLSRGLPWRCRSELYRSATMLLVTTLWTRYVNVTIPSARCAPVLLLIVLTLFQNNCQYILSTSVVFHLFITISIKISLQTSHEYHNIFFLPRFTALSPYQWSCNTLNIFHPILFQI